MWTRETFLQRLYHRMFAGDRLFIRSIGDDIAPGAEPFYAEWRCFSHRVFQYSRGVTAAEDMQKFCASFDRASEVILDDLREQWNAEWQRRRRHA